MAVRIPELFRGDSLPPLVRGANARIRGRTFADHYVTDGLVAKFADGGLSRFLDWPLHRQIAAHVGFPKKRHEQDVYFADHSPFISFARTEEAAWHFLDRSHAKRFVGCDIGLATHFMWRLSDVDAEEIEPGRYRMLFRASTAHVKRFRIEGEQRLLAGDLSSLNADLTRVIVHGHIDADETAHRAEVFDVVRYLSAFNTGIADDLLESARRLGEKWDEWLVRPMDNVQELRGHSAKLPPSVHLDLAFWALEAEPKAPATS